MQNNYRTPRCGNVFYAWLLAKRIRQQYELTLQLKVIEIGKKRDNISSVGDGALPRAFILSLLLYQQSSKSC